MSRQIETSSKSAIADTELPQAVASSPSRQSLNAGRGMGWIIASGVIAVAACTCLATLAGVHFAQSSNAGAAVSEANSADVEIAPLLAAAAASSDTMAVATGPISEDAEGIFFLDFITGDLQCLVYYPRIGQFGARYFGSVIPQLGGGGKNAKYLMVTGGAIRTANTGGARPGASLVYITDVNSGMFAAYAVPWDRNKESAGRPQTGPLVYAGGGPIRNYQLNQQQQNQPAGIVDPNKQ